MSKRLIQLLTFFISLVTVRLQDHVVELNDDTFTDLQKFKTALVLFYAPWCSHCKHLKPEFDRAASKLAKNDPPVILARIDCTSAGKTTCDLQKIGGYPTMRIYKDGKYQKDYQGERKTDGIVDEMKMRALQSVRTLRNSKELESFLKNPILSKTTKCLVVGFLNDKSELDCAFAECAEIFKRKAHFAKAPPEGDEKIVLFLPKILRNSHEPDSVEFDPKKSPNLDSFIRDNCYGLVGVRNSDNHQDFDRKPDLIVAYFDVDFDRNRKSTVKIRDTVLTVAKKYENEGATFALSPRSDFEEELAYLDSKNEKISIVAWKNSKTSYKMEPPFDLKNFENFTANYLNCSLKPTIKSAETVDNTKKVVLTAVGKNFDQLVTDNPRDVLLLFYAPWCERSKMMEKVFEEIGEKLKRDAVDLVKIDASVNDYPDVYKVAGYPTVYWLSKYDKNVPLLYRGPLEYDNVLNLVVRRAAIELQGFKRDGRRKSDAKIEL